MFILFETVKQIALSVEGREKGFTVKRETKRVKWKGGWGWGNVTSKGKFPIWFSSERILQGCRAGSDSWLSFFSQFFSCTRFQCTLALCLSLALFIPLALFCTVNLCLSLALHISVAPFCTVKLCTLALCLSVALYIPLAPNCTVLPFTLAHCLSLDLYIPLALYLLCAFLLLFLYFQLFISLQLLTVLFSFVLFSSFLSCSISVHISIQLPIVLFAVYSPSRSYLYCIIKVYTLLLFIPCIPLVFLKYIILSLSIARALFILQLLLFLYISRVYP